MENNTSNVCLPLPSTITNRVTIHEQREQYLRDFLQNLLPSCDIPDIDEELRKAFTLSKHKSKVIRKKPKKSQFLTKRKSLLLGINKFEKKSLLYSDMLPLNTLWLDYMHHMLGTDDFTSLPIKPSSSQWENVSQRLIKADYHGAQTTVIRSKCPSITGIQGIIIQDTKNTFRILSQDNIVRTIPKESCVFKIHLEKDINLEVFGKELCIRPAERSVKKFKNLNLPTL